MTQRVHNQHNVKDDWDKGVLCHWGWSICPCACCQSFRQHIFDRHSSIFSAEVALDKHRMTSSQRVWQGTKLPQGHWLWPFTDSSLLYTFIRPLSWTCNSLWHGTNYFITIHLLFLPLFFCLWPWGRGSSVRAARDLKSVYHYPGSAWRKLDSSCLSILQKCRLNSNQTFSLGYQEIYMCWSYIDTCLCNDFLCTSDLLFFVVCFTVRDFFFLNIWKGFSDTLSS